MHEEGLVSIFLPEQIFSYPYSMYCYFQVKLFNEKRADLEEQQLHLNVGLQKIRETVDQVEDLQKSLSIKRNELEEKNNMANAKLKQMVRLQDFIQRKFKFMCKSKNCSTSHSIESTVLLCLEHSLMSLYEGCLVLRFCLCFILGPHFRMNY